MLPSYPLSNGSMSSRMPIGDSNQQLSNYLGEASINHQAVHHPQMLSGSVWYSGVEGEQTMHQMQQMPESQRIE